MRGEKIRLAQQWLASVIIIKEYTPIYKLKHIHCVTNGLFVCLVLLFLYALSSDSCISQLKDL